MLFEESSFRSDYWEIAETAYTLDHLIRPVDMLQSSGSLGATARTGGRRWLNTTRFPLNTSPVLSWSAFPGRVYALFKHWADVSRPEKKKREISLLKIWAFHIEARVGDGEYARREEKATVPREGLLWVPRTIKKNSTPLSVPPSFPVL